MAKESLLQKLEEAASRAALLERDKGEAVVRIKALETEVMELKKMISLAEAKADEMLNGESATATSSRPLVPKAEAANAQQAATGIEEPPEPHIPQKDKPKRRFPIAMSFD